MAAFLESLLFRRRFRFASAAFAAIAQGFWALALAHAQLPVAVDGGRVGNHRTADNQVGFLDEFPARFVEASFFVSSLEISLAEWTAVRNWGSTNGYLDLPPGTGGVGAASPDSGQHPVVGVSWHDAVKWCNARSEMEGHLPAYRLDSVSKSAYRTGIVDQLFVVWNGSGHRLPTESEWELAARGGLDGQDFPWPGSSALFLDGATSGNACFQAEGTAPVGSYSANGFGLFDVAGNVSEWCWDWFDADAYAESAQSRGPDLPPAERLRVVRGGSWRSGPADLRVSSRGMAKPSSRRNHIGFRTVRTFVPSSSSNLVERFASTAESGRVVLRWWTASSDGIDGFRISRLVGGAWIPVHAGLHPAGGTNGPAAYVMTLDESIPVGTAVLYRIESVSGTCSATSPPVERAATPLLMAGHPSVVPGGVRIEWSSRPDERYRVVRTTNLFLSSASPLDAQIATNFFVDSNPPHAAFYGVELVGPPAP